MDAKVDKMRANPVVQELAALDKKRVLFVCLGNICRSPAGEGVLKEIVAGNGMESRWEIDSAGTGGWHVGELPDKRMRLHARHRGIELDHRCRKVTSSDFDNFDLILAMDDSNLQNLRRMAPSLEAARKIIPMASFVDSTFGYDFVPDPYYEGAEGFETVLDLLQNGCLNLYTLVSQ